ncbi:hypothetical protein ACU4GD_18560 [Cupriavidus basilensis]
MMGDVARWLMENALPLLNCPGIGEPVELSLLVSSAQMHGTPMIDTLLRTLERRHLDPARICLEIPPERCSPPTTWLPRSWPRCGAPACALP